jgi:Fic family protein
MSYNMTEVNHDRITVADNDRLDRFREAITSELKKLGPHPEKPLNVRRAADVAGISENTAGKYVDVLKATGELRVNEENPPAKFLYLPTPNKKE